MSDGYTRNSFVTHDGITLSFLEAGEGEPVVMLHGFASSAKGNWVEPGIFARVVASGRRVYALDARGHGHSDKPHDAASYGGGSMMRDVQSLFTHLGLTRAHVAGYSMGAITTAEFVTRDERARSATLGGVGAGLLTRAFRERRSSVADALLVDDPSTIENPVAKGFRLFADSTGADRHALAAIQNADAHLGFQPVDVKIPCLVIAGDNDALVGSREELAAAIPGARNVVVKGDHLTAVNDPAFADGIIAFLDSLR